MSELEQNQSQPIDAMIGQIDRPTQTVDLHNAAIGVPENSSISTREQTMAQYGYDAAIIAKLEFPTPDGRSKVVGVVDFGEIDPSSSPPIRKALPGLGRVRSRYAVVGFGDAPEDHLLAYHPIQPGSSTELGVAPDNNANQSLGLANDNNTGVEFISGRHATVALDAEGHVIIEDHSHNGTKVSFGGVASTSEADIDTVPRTQLSEAIRANAEDVQDIEQLPTEVPAVVTEVGDIALAGSGLTELVAPETEVLVNDTAETAQEQGEETVVRSEESPDILQTDETDDSPVPVAETEEAEVPTDIHEKLTLDNRYMTMLEKTSRDVLNARMGGAPQHELSRLAGNHLNSVVDGIKRSGKESGPGEVALELSAHGVVLGVEEHSDVALNKIVGLLGGGNVERQVLQGFTNQLENMKREYGNTEHLGPNIQRLMRASEQQIKTMPETFNKDGVSIAVLSASLGATPDSRQWSALVRDLHVRFGKK